MLAHERLSALREQLERDGQIRVKDLAAEWQVSEMTIRRDLRILEEQGLAQRVHGGAVPSGELTWKQRLLRNEREKRRAAEKLASCLPEQGCIYLDGSTTIYHLAGLIPDGRDLTVVTNNIDTFQRLGAASQLKAVLLGGELNRATDNLVGPIARRCISAFNFVAAFFSAFGMTSDGACEPSLDDADIKAMVAERAERIHIALNHQKIGRSADAVWNFPTVDTLLAVDIPADDPSLNPIRPLFSEIL